MGEVFARRYELLDPVAEGGMGSVWRVLDHQDMTVKAAKLLRHSDAGMLMRFIREQATRIHHPHVVTPLSWVGEDDTVLFTMPLIRGGSVAMLIGDWGPLPTAWVTTILDQTLAALQEVHRAGLVHRDVKPANLLLHPTGDRRPVVLLSDFGIAVPRDQPRLTSEPTLLGTQGYLPPEQSLALEPDPRQDLYALAVVGHEMLLGHPPPFPEGLPDTPLSRLLTQAQDPDPEARPSTAEEFRRQLQPHLSATWEPGQVEVLDQFVQGPASSRPGGVRQHPPTQVLSRPDADPEPEPRAGGATPRPRAPFGVLVLAVVGVALILGSAWLLLAR